MSVALICKCTVFLMLTLKAFSMSLPDCTPSRQSSPHIYLHTDIFKDNYHDYCSLTPTDVGAFKFFCTLSHVSSIVKDIILYVYDNEIDVSDNIH